METTVIASSSLRCRLGPVRAGWSSREHDSSALDLEKVFAIASNNRTELELPPAPRQRAEAVGELGADLLPLDIEFLNRRAHAALGARQANWEAALAARSHADVRRAIERVTREQAASGKGFPHPENVTPTPPLAVLAETLDRLSETTSVLSHPAMTSGKARRPTKQFLMVVSKR